MVQFHPGAPRPRRRRSTHDSNECFNAKDELAFVAVDLSGGSAREVVGHQVLGVLVAGDTSVDVLVHARAPIGRRGDRVAFPHRCAAVESYPFDGAPKTVLASMISPARAPPPPKRTQLGPGSCGRTSSAIR